MKSSDTTPETSKDNPLGYEKESKLLVGFAIPCIISMLVTALYNIVDQIFIGWGVGYLGNGATNVVFPLTVLALCLAVMIGDGACSYVSICFGKNQPENANRAVGSAVVLSVLVGIAVAVLYAVFQMPLLTLFGATEANFSYAKEYFTCITIGMAAGCIPIVGYNYGAQQLRRCRSVLWRLMGAEFLLGVLALLITQLFPRQIIGLFGSESELYNEFAVMTFRVYLCMLPLATVNKAAFIFMQAMGRPVESAGLSFFREVLLAVPLVMLLPRAFGLMGVLYSMPVADILTFFASCFVLLRTDRQLRK